MQPLRSVVVVPALALVLALAPTACSDSGSTGPQQQGGQMTALIDGSGFSSDFVTVIRQSGIIAVNGADLQTRAIGFQIPATGPGTFTLGVGQPVGAGLDMGGASWGAGGTLGSGAITVTSFTETRITGSFSFTVEGVTSGATPATRSIPNGQFDVEL
jgi:hypothetical protein